MADIKLRNLPKPVLEQLAALMQARYPAAAVLDTSKLADESTRLQLAYEAGRHSVAREFAAAITAAFEQQGKE